MSQPQYCDSRAVISLVSEIRKSGSPLSTRCRVNLPPPTHDRESERVATTDVANA